MRNLLLILLTSIAIPAGAAAPGDPAWYIVMHRASDGSLTEVSRQLVTLSASAAPMKSSAMSRGELRDGEVRATLRDARGEEIHSEIVRIGSQVRGEFHGTDGGEIDAVIAEPDSGAGFFVLRIPAIEGLLRLEMPDAPTQILSLPAAGNSASSVGTSAKLSSFGATGPPSNRVDILIVGDGYTLDEESKFDRDADWLAERFFDPSPYADYRPFVNVRKLFVPSPESGADQPPYKAGCNNVECCSDPSAPRGTSGRFVETAFGARFCTSQIWRLLTVDLGKVYTAAAAGPEWDEILVMVNDETYGGSGGSVAVLSTHDMAVEIAIHEYGHTFTGLADEYSSPYPGFPACSDKLEPNCEPNVTDEFVPSLIKWRDWIAPTTPIPTEDAAEWKDSVGLFAGARYRDAGMYRPHSNCGMRSLAQPFCAICREAYLQVLYGGGRWMRQPGIRLIEPGTVDPQWSSKSLEPGTSVTFSAEILQTADGTVSGQWLVNGESAGEGNTLTWAATAPGRYVIELIVSDDTPYLRPSLAELARSRRQWTVSIGDGVPRRRGVRPRGISGAE